MKLRAKFSWGRRASAKCGSGLAGLHGLGPSCKEMSEPC